MDVDAMEIEANAIHTQFKKLIPRERDKLAKEGKCFYCKKPGHMVHNCPSYPKQRFQPGYCVVHNLEKEGDEEDMEEGKNRVAHIQQMIMSLSMEEIDKVWAFSDLKNF